MWSVVALLVALGIAGIVSGIQDFVNRELSSNQVIEGESNASVLASAGLQIARESLKNDAVWGDCSGADQYCDEKDRYGMFPLYSESLSSKIEDYKLDKGKITVKVKFESPTVAVVYVEGKSDKGIVRIGAKFSKSSSAGKLPLVYSPNAYISGGYYCSYFWDGEKIAGTTNPNFTVYFNEYFYSNAGIYVPDDPAGNNPKDVTFVTNFDTKVEKYKDIDKVYSTGDIYLENGAHLGLAYSNGEVYFDDTSSADKVVENGNLKFPEFREEFEDNSIDWYSYSVPFGISRIFFLTCYGETTIVGNAPILVDSIISSPDCVLRIKGNLYIRDVSFENGEKVIVEKGGELHSKRLYFGGNSQLDVEGGTVESEYLYYGLNNDREITLKLNDGRIKSNFFYTYGTGREKTYINVEGKSTIEAIYFFSWDRNVSVKYADKSSLLTIKTNSLLLYSRGNIEIFDLADPKRAVIDTNLFYTDRAIIRGTTVLARDYAKLYNSIFIGNLFAENMLSNSYICNVVDSSGKQRVAKEDYFFNLIAPEGISLPEGFSEIAKVVCENESCVNDL